MKTCDELIIDLNLCLSEAEVIESEIPKEQRIAGSFYANNNNGVVQKSTNVPTNVPANVPAIGDNSISVQEHFTDSSAGIFKREPQDVGINFSSQSSGLNKASPGIGMNFSSNTSGPNKASPGIGMNFSSDSSGPNKASPGIGMNFGSNTSGSNKASPGIGMNFGSNSSGPSKASPGIGMNSGPNKTNFGNPVPKIKKEVSTTPTKKILPSPRTLGQNFGTPPKKIKTDFGTSPKNPNAVSGALSGATLFKMPKTDFEAASRIDENITKSADGSTCTCNVCGKVLSVMSSARRHYKTTHEVIFFEIILIGKFRAF